jgi:ketosteroid isomerase-like protein
MATRPSVRVNWGQYGSQTGNERSLGDSRMSAWEEFSDQRRGAIERFVNGDAGPYKQLWSLANDVTIFGGWGGYEQGCDAVSRRLDWAASRFGEGQIDIDNLAAGASGDLAYSVDIERNTAFVDGAARPQTALRVTHICRRDDGEWRIVHRHADRLG